MPQGQECKGNVQRKCAETSNEANSTVGMIRILKVSRDKDAILRMYKSLVRTQMEYCIEVWNPHLKQDVKLLEKVKRRDTKMIQGFTTRI